MIGFGPTFGHFGPSSTLIGNSGDTAANGNGISPFDWDVSTAAKPHIPLDPNARESAVISSNPNGFGGKTL